MKNFLLLFCLIFGVFFSLPDESRAQWIQTNGPEGGQVNCFAVSGANIFAGGLGGVFLSTNNGTNWTPFDTGLVNRATILSLIVSDTHIFAGTDGIGVWRRPLSDIITSVESFSSEQPLHFSLEQNYPNPFNPSTKIKFDLPKAGKVKIEVFNLLGRKIETLLNKHMSSGSHEIEFTKTNLPSGVYLYRIEAGDPSTGSGQRFQEVRKMILLR